MHIYLGVHRVDQNSALSAMHPQKGSSWISSIQLIVSNWKSGKGDNEPGQHRCEEKMLCSQQKPNQRRIKECCVGSDMYSYSGLVRLSQRLIISNSAPN